MVNVRSLIMATLFLVGLCVAGIASAAVMIWLFEHGNSPWMPAKRWAVLLAYTVLIFVTAAREFKAFWTKPTFWAVIAGLLVAHLGVFALLFDMGADIPLVWYIPITAGEITILVYILYHLFQRPVLFAARSRE